MPVAIEKLSAVPINALRWPILSAIQPQKEAPGTPYARRQQNYRRLSISQIPIMDNKCQDIADQEIVEEVEHVAKDRGDYDLPLVESDPRLLLQSLQHGTSLLRLP